MLWSPEAREISQFLHLHLIQIRSVAAEMIGQCSTLCVHAGRVWRLRSDKAVENPRLERTRGVQARHWASALEHHADQGSQRDGRSPLKGLCWAKCFSPFMHGNKMLAVTVSAGFYVFLSVCLAVTVESVSFLFLRARPAIYLFLYWFPALILEEIELKWHHNNAHQIQSWETHDVFQSMSMWTTLESVCILHTLSAGFPWFFP